MPKGKLDEDGGTSLLVGAKVHVVQVPYESGVNDPEAGKDGARKPQVLVVTRVISWPWDKKGGKGNQAAAAKSGKANQAAPAAKSKPAASESDSGSGSESEELAVEKVMEILGDADGKLKLPVLKSKVFAALAKAQVKADVRNATTKLLANTDFLSGREEFEVDGDLIGLAG
jgi:hypothetical protein